MTFLPHVHERFKYQSFHKQYEILANYCLRAYIISRSAVKGLTTGEGCPAHACRDDCRPHCRTLCCHARARTRACTTVATFHVHDLLRVSMVSVARTI